MTRRGTRCSAVAARSATGMYERSWYWSGSRGRLARGADPGTPRIPEQPVVWGGGRRALDAEESMGRVTARLLSWASSCL